MSFDISIIDGVVSIETCADVSATSPDTFVKTYKQFYRGAELYAPNGGNAQIKLSFASSVYFVYPFKVTKITIGTEETTPNSESGFDPQEFFSQITSALAPSE
jgi:hypothetical protein